MEESNIRRKTTDKGDIGMKKWIEEIPLNIWVAIFIFVYMISSATIITEQYYEIQSLQIQIKTLRGEL